MSMAHDRDTMLKALDRHGADLAAWPDAGLAGAARRMALADRAFRARLDNAVVLDRALAALRDQLDVEVARSGAVDRVKSAAMAGVPERRGRFRRWRLVAAAVVMAAALGALADVTILTPRDSESFEVVVLAPLDFGLNGTLLP